MHSAMCVELVGTIYSSLSMQAPVRLLLPLPADPPCFGLAGLPIVPILGLVWPGPVLPQSNQPKAKSVPTRKREEGREKEGRRKEEEGWRRKEEKGGRGNEGRKRKEEG